VGGSKGSFDEFLHPVADKAFYLIPRMARQAKFGEGVVDAVGQVGDRVNQGSVKVEEWL
jgi:hypothetical protein